MRQGWVVSAYVAVAALLIGGTAAVAVTLQPREPEAPPAPPPMADPVDPVPLDPAANAAIDSQADREWVAATAAATGIPERVLIAYGGGITATQLITPECGLGWTTLAAIGYVESRHGTHGGASGNADGRVAPDILGPVLDGTQSGEIRDTDGGALDGNTEWDRALGPLQFIPSTWALWGGDGDTNGVADPHDLDDAAYSAASYLCHAGDLSDPDTWRAAIASYNSAPSYLIAVAERANFYAAAAASTTPVE